MTEVWIAVGISLAVGAWVAWLWRISRRPTPRVLVVGQGPVCVWCHRSFTEEPVLSVLGQPWHQECYEVCQGQRTTGPAGQSIKLDDPK